MIDNIDPVPPACERCGSTSRLSSSPGPILCRACENLDYSPSTSSSRGIGTTFYGECDYHQDGSYITTKWFIFFQVPVFPISSHRVRYEGPGEGGIPFFRQIDSYVWYYSRRPHVGQVLRTYIATLFLIFVWFPLMLFAIIRMPDAPYQANLMLIIVAAFGVPMLVLLGLRRLAKHRAGIGGDRRDP